VRWIEEALIQVRVTLMDTGEERTFTVRRARTRVGASAADWCLVVKDELDAVHVTDLEWVFNTLEDGA